MAVLAQHKEPLQPVGGFPNSFDDGEWTMGDLAHLDTVSNKLLAVLDDVKTAQRKEQAGLLDLQNSCVKGAPAVPDRTLEPVVMLTVRFSTAAQLKCAEIQRFKDNMANPEFHRQLKAQELGPEQAETQGHLRSLVSVSCRSRFPEGFAHSEIWIRRSRKSRWIGWKLKFLLSRVGCPKPKPAKCLSSAFSRIHTAL